MAVNNEEYINKIYDANNQRQQAALQQAYDADVSTLKAEQQANQRQTDANLNRTYVESQKAQQAWNERQNAYGLSSGAQAQANLARDNQLQADLTALRGIQQQSDADVERRRTLRASQYQSEIQQAAAANDIEKVKALYQAAKDEDAKLYAQQEAAGKLMASQTGDYSVLGQLYGLTPDQIARLNFNPAAAASSGSGGGSSSPATVNTKTKTVTGSGNTSNYNGLTLADIVKDSDPYSDTKTQNRTVAGLMNLLK